MLAVNARQPRRNSPFNSLKLPFLFRADVRHVWNAEPLGEGREIGGIGGGDEAALFEVGAMHREDRRDRSRRQDKVVPDIVQPS